MALTMVFINISNVMKYLYVNTSNNNICTYSKYMQKFQLLKKN